MTLSADTLRDEILLNLYRHPPDVHENETHSNSPANTQAAADSWADALEAYISDILPVIDTTDVGIDARRTAAVGALKPVFDATTIGTVEFNIAFSAALEVWTLAVGLSFVLPTVVVLTPLAATLVTSLEAAFVLNSTIQPEAGIDYQQVAVSNIATAIDTWVQTGTAQTAPGPPPVIVNWS